MKHVKRILVSLLMGLIMGLIMGLVWRFGSNSETWLHDAVFAGWFFALGCWLGTGFEFFHED